MESNRQKKVAGLLQKDISAVIQETLRQAGVHDILVSVTKVNVTVDLASAKVYLSIFPTKEATRIIKEVNHVKSQIKHQIAIRVKNQLRKMPELYFFNDDSLEYIDKINKAIEGDQNPIKDPNLLDKRKKK